MAVSLKAFFWRSFFRVCSRLFPRPYENTLKRTIFKIVFSQANGSKMRGNRADPLDHHAGFGISPRRGGSAPALLDAGARVELGRPRLARSSPA